MLMTSSSTNITLKRNPPAYAGTPRAFFSWRLHESRRRMRYSSRTGEPKARRHSRPDVEYLQSSVVGFSLTTRYHYIFVLPPSTAPLSQCATSIHPTSVAAWRNRRARGPVAFLGRQGTTAARGAVHSSRSSCDNYALCHIGVCLRERRATPRGRFRLRLG
jgi:hypothetical protein